MEPQAQVTKEQIRNLTENIDAWVKQINREFSLIPEIDSRLCETVENVQHNYELIYELRDEVEELKQDINAIKLLQIIALKNKSLEEQRKIS